MDSRCIFSDRGDFALKYPVLPSEMSLLPWFDQIRHYITPLIFEEC
jgi:hypothetical protein